MSERTPALSTELSPRKEQESAAAVRVTGDDTHVEELEALVLDSLEDDKAEDIVAIDLRGKSSVTDIMIVASGRSARHVNALADHLVRKLKENGSGKARVEGMQTCDWVLIDAGDVIVHLFRPEVRTFYNLEKMWSVEPEATAS
ncbi:ribosome silencing factor [Maricaulis parjimensis]|uniref:ribosome silencing factor n=1 Tax=Maricaulis parjimensis TaxID=144023 RepID=UPI0019392F7E|nr:ribosome silencing factor [Maricaulis parjimensis]